MEYLALYLSEDFVEYNQVIQILTLKISWKPAGVIQERSFTITYRYGSKI